MYKNKTFYFRQFLLKAAIFSIPLNHIGSPIPLLDITRFILLIYLFVSLPFIIQKNIIKKNLKTPLLLTGLYLLIAGVSFFNYIPDTQFSYSFFRQFPMLIVLFFVFADAFSKKILSLKTIMETYVYGMVMLGFLFLVGVDVSVSSDGRLEVLGINPNRIAILSDIALLFMFDLIRRFKLSNYKRFFFYIFMIVLVYMIILTGSRGGFFGLLILVLVYFYSMGGNVRGKYKNVIKGFFLAAILSFIFLSNDVIYERIFGDEGALIESRLPIWQKAMDIVSGNLFWGVGVFKYEVEITRLAGRFQATHNEFVSILVYSGIFGLFIFLIFLFQAYQQSKKVNRDFQNPVFLSLLALVVFSLFKGGGVLLSVYVWFVLSLIFSSYNSLNTFPPKKTKNPPSLLLKI